MNGRKGGKREQEERLHEGSLKGLKRQTEGRRKIRMVVIRVEREILKDKCKK